MQTNMFPSAPPAAEFSLVNTNLFISVVKDLATSDHQHPFILSFPAEKKKGGGGGNNSGAFLLNMIVWRECTEGMKPCRQIDIGAI